MSPLDSGVFSALWAYQQVYLLSMSKALRRMQRGEWLHPQGAGSPFEETLHTGRGRAIDSQAPGEKPTRCGLLEFHKQKAGDQNVWSLTDPHEHVLSKYFYIPSRLHGRWAETVPVPLQGHPWEITGGIMKLLLGVCFAEWRMKSEGHTTIALNSRRGFCRQELWIWKEIKMSDGESLNKFWVSLLWGGGCDLHILSVSPWNLQESLWSR